MIPVLILLALQDTTADELIRKLADDSIEVREEATARLREMGDLAAPPLLRAVRSDDAEVRARATDLLHLLGARAPVSSLRLRLESSERGENGGVKVTLCAENAGAVPVMLHRKGLSVRGILGPPRIPVLSGLYVERRIDPFDPYAEFAWLWPGESLRVEFSGGVSESPARLVPEYSFRRSDFRLHVRSLPEAEWEKAPWNLALEGDQSGGEISFAPVSPIVVRIFTLQNTDAAETARKIRDFYPAERPRSAGPNHDGFSSLPCMDSHAPPVHKVDVSVDTRTNSVMVRAESDIVRKIETFVTGLDLDPTPGADLMKRIGYQMPPEELAKILRALLKEGAGRSGKLAPIISSSGE